MDRKKAIVIAKCAVGLGVIPVLLWAHSTGPDAHHTAVPVPGGPEPSCNQVGCHVGTTVNGGGGNVTISTTTNNTYTPGQKQTFTITVTDSAARVYGFQMTARPSGDLAHSTGTFTPGSRQFVLCASTALTDVGRTRTGTSCPASQPVEFIEHSRPFTTNTITVDWTPDASASGPIAIYVAANAANGNGNETGDHIYTANITLQPAVTQPVCSVTATPSISSGGIVNASDFGAKAGVAPGTWVEIYGQNLAGSSREWAGSDFSGNNAPTQLDGVAVTIGGKQAFIRFVSSGQVDAQVPDGIGTGPVPVVVTNCGGSSGAANINASATLPGILAPASFKVNGKQYVVAQLPDTKFAGDPAILPAAERPVRPGETITLYGIGFGPVNPSFAPGVIVGGQNRVTGNLKILFGQVDATSSIQYAGLSPNFIGLYQFNVTVPSSVPAGDQQLSVTLDGVDTGQNMFITVRP